MAYPETETLERVPQTGIGLVISLVEGTKMDYKAVSGLRLAHLPIDDCDVPAPDHIRFVARLCALIHAFRTQQGVTTSVAVHCHHGRGRTGLILACYRVWIAIRHPEDSEGQTPPQALSDIDRALEGLYGVAGLGPSPRQVQYVSRFLAYISQHTPKEYLAAGDLAWETWPADVSSANRTWTCDGCEQTAYGTGEGLPCPLWCPRCGCPTGHPEYPCP